MPTCAFTQTAAAYGVGAGASAGDYYSLPCRAHARVCMVHTWCEGGRQGSNCEEAVAAQLLLLQQALSVCLSCLPTDDEGLPAAAGPTWWMVGCMSHMSHDDTVRPQMCTACL